jgi:hypothetical protein
MFDILFPLKRGGNRLVSLKIDQRLDAVPLGETICQALSMLVNAPHKIVRLRRHIVFHRACLRECRAKRSFALMDCRVKSGNEDW